MINCQTFLTFQNPTFLHIFMCEITLDTVQLTKSYSAKNCRFLGALGVVYNYIHSIYYIFFERYTIRLFFFIPLIPLECRIGRLVHVLCHHVPKNW